MLRPIIIGSYLVLFVLSLLFTGPASAQIAVIDTVQSDLANKPALEQSAILAAAVREAWKGRNCTRPKVSLEKTYKEQSGGWLVLCDEGQDYWVLVLDRPKSAAAVLPCILARRSGTDCYANLRTILPEDIKQCAPSSGSLDRVIRSCTTIIQSHQFDNRPEVLFLGYVYRAVAFGGYQQFDLAIADFDKAVALQPGDIDARYNRAVTLERKGEFDQALLDLATVIEARPNDVNGLYERGYVYLKKGDYDRAIGDFDQVLRINPQFEKATRNRAEAIKAKDSPASSKVAAVEATFPTTPNEQAAYCMEASFGYTQQLTKLLAILRENREKGQALLGGTNVSQADKEQLAKHMTTLNDSIASSDEKKKTWEANLSTFLTYVQRHGLLTQDRNMIASMSGQVRRDQEAVHSTYTSCLRSCVPNDASCKRTCDERANSSEASKRMLRCAEAATSFK